VSKKLVSKETTKGEIVEGVLLRACVWRPSKLTPEDARTLVKIAENTQFESAGTYPEELLKMSRRGLAA